MNSCVLNKMKLSQIEIRGHGTVGIQPTVTSLGRTITKVSTKFEINVLSGLFENARKYSIINQIPWHSGCSEMRK